MLVAKMLAGIGDMTANARWRAAIVGLGKIGSRFDEEPGRSNVWSHAGAYLARPQLFAIAGACETVAENAAAFARRCPDVPVAGDIASMLRVAKPSIVSICTPAESHNTVLTEVLRSDSVRVVWCEKPLAASARDGAAMVDACRARGVTLLVSYVRRWSPVWIRAREIVQSGALGAVRVVRIAIPNRLWSMGSHAVDLVEYLGGPVTAVTPFAVPDLAEEGEPAVAAFFRFSRDGYGLFQVTGWKANYLVEGEVVGDCARIIVREDYSTISCERFETSPRYEGYREPGKPDVQHVAIPANFSPFVAIAEEIGELLAGTRRDPTCDGATALAVQTALERMAACAAPTGSSMEER
jgi:myo-inositol 2-dehydrogenase/D-chiro-inositol 1-dehydrogenase